MEYLNNKTALITGAGRGLGAACAELLTSQGVSCTLVARTQSEVETLAARLPNARAHVADLTQMDQITGLADLGSFDILVNNAGTNRPKTFLDVTEEDYDAVERLNLKSCYFVAQTVARGMVAAGKGGSIINMSSQMGHVGGLNRTIYCATKHGIEGLTKAMALDLAKAKIRVNTVCPTFVLTPMTEPFMADPAFKQDTLARIPLGELAVPNDVAEAVAFLASDSARMITGSAIKVDGGWTAI